MLNFNSILSSFKHYHYYYLLAAFDIVMLIFSLQLNHQNVVAFEDTLSNSKSFVAQTTELEKLAQLAALASAPGNDVFDSHNPKSERAKLTLIISQFNTQLERLKDQAKQKNNRGQLNSLNRLDNAFKNMLAEAENIFQAFENQNIKFAGSRMATMDQKFVNLNKEISSIRKTLIYEKSIFIKKQVDQVSSIRLYEKVLGFSILIIVVSVSILGHMAGRRMEQQDKLLIQSSKMSALGEMAGGVAHEINNPIATIRLKASQLRRMTVAGKLTPEESISMLQNIEDTTVRIAKIVDGLRTFSRNDQGDEPSIIEISKILDDVSGICIERFKRNGVELELNSPEDVVISCRVVQIEQVLVNLVNNAFDAIRNEPNAWVRVNTKLSGDSVQISVTDSGLGIPAEIAAKIMQPFFSTKPVGHGTGLGLSISLGIVEAHGGSLTLNKDSKNTQFVLQLPKVVAVAPEAVAGVKKSA